MPITDLPQNLPDTSPDAASDVASGAALGAAIQRFAPPLPLAVAFSGGADSTALLLACAERWPGQVVAIHVHHGLQSAADAFVLQCEKTCAQHAVPLKICRVDARHAPGQSPEDAARQLRYATLIKAANEPWPAQGGVPMPAVRSLALAQHADDQVETLLLALSRGAGVAGLAAMPAQWSRAGLAWYRPLLDLPGQVLRDWLAARGQEWVEDPSNADARYTRNRIRAQLLPALHQAFPQFRATFARSSRHCAEAAELLQEMAQADLGAVGNPPRIAALQALSPARQANVLRHWLRSVHATTPSAAQLDQLLAQVGVCRTRGHRIHLKMGRGFVRRLGSVLDWYN
ncbi:MULTISPECIES: tRNA lysidine(34) synthetase TilS [Delftia]|jgi:tRNA(Ile)-lysidine synthase|uniref:tRNA lysidine(34) synthetase TilS n=1 Tax=Delftia TaxID=80865 RepID=UPI000641A434|nr:MULTISPECIES: tRNA lysidine(34) synthetase TilS [Delftia]KLO61595.1 tRNA(Ile)-lysidine synthetase [Delftia tsuruhatensis]OJX12523.1 MAG: tRNA lysidine(34) synthetase TilS [Delftia sp. 67-8]QFS66617.1 tRNA lysidine(34) synthetase TilS [Delftia tsuruhatensis]WON88144.1 tRNA lysidine(34) synthetase TilS [Delftia sp. UGAL515B_04]